MNDRHTTGFAGPRVGSRTETADLRFGGASSGPSIPFRRPLFWIGLVSFFLLFADLGSYALIEGEAMYAEIAREMRVSGDYITPHLNGTRHFDKPAFLYWLIALSQGLLGETESAARMWPVLATWGTIFVVAGIGSSLYGSTASRLGALVFAACTGPHIFGRLAMPDGILCFWIALAVLGYVRGYPREGDPTGWRRLMFASLGFAALTKGILGLGLGSAVIGLHVLLGGGLRRFLTWDLVAGVLLTLLVAVPWYGALGIRNPDFFGYFFIREHLLRFTGQRYPRDECLSLPVFLAFTYVWTFPWLAFLPPALVRGFKRLRLEGLRKSPDLLPLVWIFVVLGLFSASQSRLEYYALPCLPAFALLMGKYWEELSRDTAQDRSRKAAGIALGILTVLLAMAALAAMIILGPQKEVIFHAFQQNYPDAGWVEGPVQLSILDRIHFPTIATLLGTAVCMGLATAALFRGRTVWSVRILAGMMIPVFLLIHWGFRVMEPYHSTRAMAEIVRQAATPDHIVVFTEPHEYMWVGGITYYTKRLVHILKDPRYDHVSTRRREPPQRFLDNTELTALWTSDKPVLLVADVTRRDVHPILAAAGSVEVVARIGNLVTYGNQGGSTPAQPLPGPSHWPSPSQ